MKHTLTAILVLAIALHYSPVSAQTATTNVLNPAMEKIARPGSEANFIRFKDEIKIDPETVFTKYAEAFNLGENDQMVLLKKESDDLGFTHLHYHQFYKNIRVDGGIIKVHTNAKGITYAVTGRITGGININTIPNITPAQAIEFALKHVAAKEYKWQSDYWEKEIKARTGQTDSSYYPAPELVIREVQNKEAAVNSTVTRASFLAYRIDVYSSSPDYSQRLFVDAQTGKILEVFPLQSN